jgi:predicted nucleotidyltransferase
LRDAAQEPAAVQEAASYTDFMRLTSAELAAIRDTVRAVAGTSATVRLFGSRTDDGARGGDIDLLVELAAPVASAVRLSARIAARLQQVLGDRRIDVLIAAPKLPESPIHRVARDSGVLL